MTGGGPMTGDVGDGARISAIISPPLLSLYDFPRFGDILWKSFFEPCGLGSLAVGISSQPIFLPLLLLLCDFTPAPGHPVEMFFEPCGPGSLAVGISRSPDLSRLPRLAVGRSRESPDFPVRREPQAFPNP